MGDPYPDWKSLPNEVLKIILQLATDYGSTYKKSDCSLVCKSWVLSAQSVIYSNVEIKNLSQLIRFSETVRHNTALGRFVKVFDLSFYYPHVEEQRQQITVTEMYDLVAALLSKYLPNIEEIKADDLKFYTSVLKTLNNSSHLKRLKMLQDPGINAWSSEVSNYVKCALLLKDRLESICIILDNHNFIHEIKDDQLSFNNLYNELHQFDRLSKVFIGKDRNENIQTLEHVVEACKLLRNIRFYSFQPPVYDDEDISLQSSSISISTISNFTPRSNIKIFRASLCMSNINEVLAYVMHKFPQLRV